MEGPRQSCPTPFPTRLGPGGAALSSAIPHGLEEATGLLNTILELAPSYLHLTLGTKTLPRNLRT